METTLRMEGSETEEHDPVKNDGYPAPGDDLQPGSEGPMGLTEGAETEEHDPVKTDSYPAPGD